MFCSIACGSLFPYTLLSIMVHSCTIWRTRMRTAHWHLKLTHQSIVRFWILYYWHFTHTHIFSIVIWFIIVTIFPTMYSLNSYVNLFLSIRLNNAKHIVIGPVVKTVLAVTQSHTWHSLSHTPGSHSVAHLAATQYVFHFPLFLPHNIQIHLFPAWGKMLLAYNKGGFRGLQTCTELCVMCGK